MKINPSRTLFAAGILLCSLAAAAAPAIAGTPGASVSLGTSKGLEYMRGKYVNVVTQTGQPVSCPEGKDATGGGGSIIGPPDQVVLNESYPTLPGPTGWTVEGSSASGPQTMLGYAICSRVNTRVGTSNAEVPPDSSVTQNAFCPSGDVVTGGGIEATSSGIRMESSYPPELISDRWFGAAKNTSENSIPVSFHAMCTDRYDVNYRYRLVEDVDPGDEAAATAACQPDEAALGGGSWAFNEGLAASGGWVTESRPKDSRADAGKVPDDGWRAKYHNDAVVTHNLLVAAACMAGRAAS